MQEGFVNNKGFKIIAERSGKLLEKGKLNWIKKFWKKILDAKKHDLKFKFNDLFTKYFFQRKN